MTSEGKSALLEQFDAAVKTVHLHDGPRPGGKSDDWLKGQDIGILQGLKIARSILETFPEPPKYASFEQRAAELLRRFGCTSKDDTVFLDDVKFVVLQFQEVAERESRLSIAATLEMSARAVVKKLFQMWAETTTREDEELDDVCMAESIAIIERESRLSIAAALETAAQRVLSMWHHSYAKEIAQAIRDLTDADVAHARAEHDREVREKALEEAAKLAETYCERHASSMHVVNPKRIAEELRALASATEETRQAASPEDSGSSK